MRNILLLTSVALIAIAIGAGLYLYMPTQFFSNSVPSAVQPAGINTAPAQTRVVTFRVLDTGTHAAGVSVQTNYAASSEEDFAKLWKMSHGTDGKTLPEIDFSKEYVMGVFAGQKPSGGYSVAVASVTDAGNTRTVAITLTSPGEGCMVTESLTNPYQIIAVPLSDASLAHTDTEVSTPCK